MFTSRKTQQKKILGVLGLLATVLILYKYRDKIKKKLFPSAAATAAAPAAASTLSLAVV